MASVAITATVAPMSDLPLALHHPLYLTAPAVEQRRSDAEYVAAVDLLADRILAHEAEYRRTGLVHTIASRSVLGPLLSTRSRGGASSNPNSATTHRHRDTADAALARRVLYQGIPLNEQEWRDRLRTALEDKQTIGSARPGFLLSEKAFGNSRKESPSTKVVFTKTANLVTLLDTFSASKVASSNSALSASKARRISTPSRPKQSEGALGGPTRDGPHIADSSIEASRPVRRLGSQPARDIDAASPKGLATSGSRSLGRDEQVLFEGGCTQMELPDPS